MSFRAVARKDFRDGIRSRVLWVLSALFIVVFSGPTVVRFFVRPPEGAQQDIVQVFVLVLMKEVTSVLVPLLAVVVAYAAITREVESGSLKLLLSLPHSREDVVYGKVLGRAGVLGAPIAVGFAVAALLLLGTGASLVWGKYLAFAVLTILLGVVFVGIAVGISAAVESTQRAIFGTVGVFLVTNFAWNWVVNEVADLLRDLFSLGTTGRYEVALLLKLLNPIQAYKTLVDSLFIAQNAARQQMFGFLLFGDPAAREAFSGQLALPFTDPFVVLYFLLWGVVGVFVGAVRFQKRDL